jgi:hypothetical protein
MATVTTRVEEDMRYRAIERVVGLAELEAFLDRAIEELGPGDGPPFAIFHGPVSETTQSRIEVGVPTASGDRVLEGGMVVCGLGPVDADYDSIHVVYDAIRDYIVANGLEQRGHTREVYRPDAIEIQWPVA